MRRALARSLDAHPVGVCRANDAQSASWLCESPNKILLHVHKCTLRCAYSVHICNVNDLHSQMIAAAVSSSTDQTLVAYMRPFTSADDTTYVHYSTLPSVSGIPQTSFVHSQHNKVQHALADSIIFYYTSGAGRDVTRGRIVDVHIAVADADTAERSRSVVAPLRPQNCMKYLPVHRARMRRVVVAVTLHHSRRRSSECRTNWPTKTGRCLTNTTDDCTQSIAPAESARRYLISRVRKQATRIGTVANALRERLI